MTSKKSSVNPVLFTFKNALKSSALAPAITLFCGLLITVFLPTTVSLFETYLNQSGNIERNSDNFKYLFFAEPNMYAIALPVLLACAGVLISVTLFNFVTSKKTVNVYYSLGIKRENLFLAKYSAGALLITLAEVVPMTVTLIVNIAACGFSIQLLRAYFYITVTLLAVTLVAFSVTSAVFAAVGTVFETAVFSGVLLFLPTVILFSLQTLMDKFVYGNSYGETFYYAGVGGGGVLSTTSLSDKFGFLSPVFFGNESLSLFSAMDKTGKYNIRISTEAVVSGSPDFTATVLWLVAAAAITALGVIVFKKRKAEICGFIGTNKYLNTVIVFAVAFYAYCGVLESSDLSALVSMLIGAAVFTVIYIIAELIILRDTRKFKKGLVKLPVEIAVCIAVTLVFSNGFFGYSEKTPELKEVKSAAVSFGGVADEYGYYAEDVWGNTLIKYLGCGGLVDGFESEKDIAEILDIHKKVSQNKFDGDEDYTVQFVYELKNGTVFKRSFTGVSPECYNDLLKLENTDVYKKRLYDIFKGEISTDFLSDSDSQLYNMQNTIRNDNSYFDAFSQYLDKGVSVQLESAEREKLVNCLYSDLLKRSSDEKYYPDSTPEMYFQFSYYETVYRDESIDDKIEKFDYYDLYDFSLFGLSVYSDVITIAVTPDMKSTLRYAKELGIYDKLTEKPKYDSVEIVSAADYRPNDYYYSEYGHGHNMYFVGSSFSEEYSEEFYSGQRTLLDGEIFTDKDVVENALKNAYTSYQTDTNGYFAAFYNKEDGNTTFMYIPEEKLDAAVKAKLN